MKAILITLVLMAVSGYVWLSVEEHQGEGELKLLNVSYDPTRGLWRDLNKEFLRQYQSQTGKKLAIKVSHGGSSSQATAVFSGLPADVVSLALWSDVDVLVRHHKIEPDWEKRLPPPEATNVADKWKGKSVAYYSTIVFVVRYGNPKYIRDWNDLVRPGVAVITPNPKTSGNGRLSFLAAWGAEYRKNRSEQDANDFVAKLYRNVPVLDSGARGSTTTFLHNQEGDVHLTWENEAHFEVEESRGKVEIVYPSCSILAEPPVAVVDANVDAKGTRAAAEAYLRFLFTEPAQRIAAQHKYRPVDDKVLKEYADTFPARTTLFPVTELARNWDEVKKKFFADGAIFDSIYLNR